MQAQSRIRLAGLAFFAVARGVDSSNNGQQTLPPPWDGGFATVRLDRNSYYLLGLQETTTAVAQVSNGNGAVTWQLKCDDGQATLTPNGDTAALTALGSGMCFISANIPTDAAGAIVGILPMAIGDDCGGPSQCGADAPLCRSIELGCDPTCTTSCQTDADCPRATTPYAWNKGCHGGVCNVVRDPVWSCP